MTHEEDHVRELAGYYRRHFAAATYKEGAQALAQAEEFQRRLAADHGEEYARRVDGLAYRIGHG